MATLTEGKHAGEFIISEGNGTISRDSIVVKSGQNILTGELIGVETATGKIVAYDPANTIIGSSTITGVSFDNYDATLADVNGISIARYAEVRGSDLDYNEAVAGVTTTQITGLKSLGIIVR